MNGTEAHARLQAADRHLGTEERTLLVGESAIRIEGLDREIGSRLDLRWGRFLAPSSPGKARATVRLFRGGSDYWLDRPRSGEAYRIEALDDGPRRIVASYHFAIGRDRRAGGWRVGITEEAAEPLERILDNVLRFVTAHLAVEEGGFAMHSAGVLHDGRAWLFAGPSRAGKSTVVRLLAPALSLGDDFGVVVPARGGWCAPALPFDNSGRIDHVPPAGWIPVAGIWRLFQADQTRIERLPLHRAMASLMACNAFPWTMPELSSTLLLHVERFVREGSFAHLHFTRDADLWPQLLRRG